MDDTKYHYSARVIDVHDGDTIRCDIDLGFGKITLRNQAFRFFGINAPEITWRIECCWSFFSRICI
jgi:endonuclease YncB( thermonuclease family)